MKREFGAFLGCIFVFFLLQASQAGWLDMPDQWRVFSVYTDPVTGQKHEVVWEYTVDREAKALTVATPDGRLDLELEAGLDEGGLLRRLTEAREVGQRTLSSGRDVPPSRPQVVTQGMVPLSLLHDQELQDTDFPVQVTEVTSAGGAVFATTYQLNRQALSRERALEEGLIRAEQSVPAGTGPLLDYSLRDKEGMLVLRQIWNGELPFWLHETTENRRSWLLPVGG